MCGGIEVIAVRAVAGVCRRIDNGDAVCLVVTSRNTTVASAVFVIIVIGETCTRNLHFLLKPRMKMGGRALQKTKLTIAYR